MSSLDRIHMLKRILKETLNIVDWQQEIYTALHNIDASWIVSGILAWDRMPFDTWAELLSKLTKDVGDYLNLASLQIGGVEVITALRVLQNVTADAGIITSGVFDVARIPDLDASKIVSGTFDVARIPDLDASKITSGVFDVARIPGLDASKIISGEFDVARIPDLDASKIVSGVFDLARIPDIPWTKIPDVNKHLLPYSDCTYDLGSSSKRWRNIELNGVVIIA